MSRILLSAYACEPDKGSEPGVGWLWATQLASLGHEVYVITRTSNRAAIEEALRLQRPPHLNFVYCDLNRWALQWKRLPGAIYFYCLLWQWLAYRCARRLTNKLQFDCVQHVTFVSLRVPSFMGLLGIPFYLGPVSGGERVPWQLRRAMSWKAQIFELLRDFGNAAVRCDPVMRAMFHRAERIYLTSDDSLNLVPSAYRHKCVVQLAVGLSRMQLGLCARRIAPHGQKLRCLYVGRLLEWKGLRLTLRAMACLKAQDVPSELTIIGEGPAFRKLQRQAQKLGISERLHWTGALPNDAVQRQYSRHHVLLFPSLRDSGGMVVLEALAHGVPVICADLGGPAAIVTGECGRVVSTNDKTDAQVAKHIADHLHHLARNRGLLERLSIGARRRAWEFEFGSMAEAIHGAEKCSPDEAMELAFS